MNIGAMRLNVSEQAARECLGSSAALEQNSTQQLAQDANVPFSTSEIMFRGASGQQSRPLMGDQATKMSLRSYNGNTKPAAAP